MDEDGDVGEAEDSADEEAEEEGDGDAATGALLHEAAGRVETFSVVTTGHSIKVYSVSEI